MKENNNYAVPLSIIVAGLVIAGAVFFSNGNNSKTDNAEQQGNTAQDVKVKPIVADDHVLGNPNADVVLVEYSDLECPFCKMYHETTKRIMSEYKDGGKVALVFRQYPIEQLHSKAKEEAIATECTGLLGGNDKFWTYLDKLFETTPSNDGLDLTLLPKMAGDIGLNKSDFEKCLKDNKASRLVEDDMKSGAEAGVRGTPHTFVMKNGKVVSTIDGAQPYEAVKSAIDTALVK